MFGLGKVDISVDGIEPRSLGLCVGTNDLGVALALSLDRCRFLLAGRFQLVVTQKDRKSVV